ncbi:MAG: fumarylacetoacetate hydrolase family protein [Nitriliruptoraceae bacterium]|nr:fumarylacetoacetate hydrolase family protein [Nitriliruptoraceae bacterium]
MRIVRVAVAGETVVGRLLDEGVEELAGWPVAPRPTGRRFARDAVRLLAPVVPSKIVAIGRNYLAHIAEMGYEPPPEPSLFLKPPSSVIGPDDDVVLPPRDLTAEVQHEAEVAVVIGRRARHLTRDEVWGAIAGVTCADDVTARDLQRRDPGLTRAKSFDTFCPIGPWVETEVDLRGGLSVSCHVNGELRQQGHSSGLVHDIAAILAFASQVMTLEPGDVVLTGSPGGTATLHPGDRVRIGVEGVGTLEHGCVRAPVPTA